MKFLILYNIRDKNLKEPEFLKGYRECYDYLASLAEKQGLVVYKSNFTYLDDNKNKFNFAWKFDRDKWIKVKSVNPDIIFYKSKRSFANFEKVSLLERKNIVINCKEFLEIFTDKFLSYVFFPDYFASSFLIKTQKDIKHQIDKVKSNRVVLKPLSGAGGFGIEILSKPKAVKFKPKAPMIMQEFIDTSKGYGKFVSGVHDLRVFMINEKIAYAYFRVSKKGSLLSNIHQGGKMINIKNNQIPKSVKKIISQVNQKLKPFGPRIFSIDFFFDPKGKPYIVEFNTRPGIYFYPEDKKLQTKVYLGMIKLFKESALRDNK